MLDIRSDVLKVWIADRQPPEADLDTTQFRIALKKTSPLQVGLGTARMAGRDRAPLRATRRDLVIVATRCPQTTAPP